MLRKIKQIYENIGDYLLDAEQFKEDFVKDADILASTLDDYYRCERMLRSELYVCRSIHFCDLIWRFMILG